MGEERERRERGRERRRERERERERVPYRIMLFTIRWELHYVFTRQFSRVLTPRPQLSRFFTGISRRRYVVLRRFCYNGELVSLLGSQRVGIFPPKSKILFVLSLALIWCQNFQDWTIPVGGDTWPSCTSERKYKNKEIIAFRAMFPVKYLRNGKRYSSSVFTVTKGKSHATKRCKPSLCCCYRFRDIKSSTSWFSNADLYDVVNPTPVRMYSYG